MKIIKVSEATTSQLDWLVAKCESSRNDVTTSDVIYWETVFRLWEGYRSVMIYTTDWSQGGPIIEREWLCADRLLNGQWLAAKRNDTGDSMLFAQGGTTPLIAAMRCYVASKLGSEAEIPESLIES